MTQLFLEDGRVERVTVLEAGPCPVTRDPHEGPRRVRGPAARVRRQRRRSTSPSPEIGHLKKAGAPAMRHLVEFRDEAGEWQVGDTVTVETFEVGQKLKIAGTSKGKGFQGTIKRHKFASGPKSHGSHNVRAPGSIGASAWPARVMKGIRGPGQMGNERVTQKGLEGRSASSASDNLLHGPRLRARAPATAWWRSAPWPSHRQEPQRQARSSLDDAAFAAKFNGPLVHETVRAELAARRQGTHATKTRGMVRGGGAKPWRQKGTGRARAGSSRSPIWTGGGTVFGPSPRHYTFKVNRKERRAAFRSALSIHAERGSLAVFDVAPPSRRRRPRRPRP